jgi:hypothetical protein
MLILNMPGTDHPKEAGLPRRRLVTIGSTALRLIAAMAASCIAGCGVDTPKPKPAETPIPARAAGEASLWTVDPDFEPALGPETTILEGRYVVRGPLDFKPSGQTMGGAVEFGFGKDSIGFQLIRGLPERVTLDEYVKKTAEIERAMPGKQNFRMSDVESGIVGGRPYRRYRYAYESREGAKSAGFAYFTAHDEPDRHILMIGGQGIPESMGLLEASALSTREAKQP